MNRELIILLIALFACRPREPYNRELSFGPVPDTSQRMKLSGYYTHYDPVGVYTVLFLFQNGIVRHVGSFDEEWWMKIQNDIPTEVFEKTRDLEIWWGVFQIRGDSILMERWHPANGVYYVFREQGLVINDSTFVLTETVLPPNEPRLTYYEEFHFKQYSPKPDSTTQWIK